jgi:cytoskeletal protein RodZ
MTELGKVLKEARESKGLTLDDLQQITKIQKRYLVGIEEGNYEMMPGKFYVRAFIKQYAEAVGLDPEQLFTEHQTDIPAAVQQEELPQKLSRVQSKKTLPVQNSKWMELLPKILIAVFLVAVVAIIYYFVAKAIGNNDDTGTVNQNGDPVRLEQGESTNQEQNTKEKEETETETEKESNPENAEEDSKESEEVGSAELKVTSANGKNTTYELSNTDEFKVSVKSTGETWVSVKNSKGENLFNGVIQNGESQDFDLSDDNQIVMNIGKTPDTEIFVNDEKLEYESELIVQNITIDYTKE